MSEAQTRETAIRAAFVKQGEWCGVFGAPFTASVCEALGMVLDRATETGRRVLDWPGDLLADALVLRLTGGLNALARAGALPRLAVVYPPCAALDASQLAERLTEALADPRLPPWLDSAPQTNEVARAGVLMPGMMTIAAATSLPLRLFELGTSAGLNLRMSDYCYDLGGMTAGSADAPVTLAPRWTGPPPPAALVTIVARRGVDLAPVDVRRAEDRDRLLAYVWPEQTERVARLKAAITAFAADPIPLDKGDAADWTEANVLPVSGTAAVVFHSIAWHYFPAVTRTRIAVHIAVQGARATVDAPLAWLRYEEDVPGGGRPPTLRLTLWPGGENRLLAEAHPHGASVRWFG